MAIQKKYNIENLDINPFIGTNLDAESTNTNTVDNYNTYKNTVYKHDGIRGWVPDGTVINGNYTNGEIRKQMGLESNMKIFQKEGIGTSVNATSTTQTDIHSKREGKAVKVKPIKYTPKDKVEMGKLNQGNWSSHYTVGYEGDFDKNMELVATSDNQMTYRSYTSGSNDVFTNMSDGIKDESTISGKATNNKIDITLGGAVIEAGKHFNRGNDTTIETKTKDNKITGVDINSSRVLDMSMYLNNYNSDILSLRGGAGIGKDGKYPTE